MAARRGGEALLVDPVRDKVEQYLALIRELDLRLVKALDTHVHADHVSGLGELRDRTRCVTVMGTRARPTSCRSACGTAISSMWTECGCAPCIRPATPTIPIAS